MGQFLGKNSGRHVRDTRYAEHWNSHVVGNNHLRNGGHPDSIGAENAAHAYFCRGFVAGTHQPDIDALPDRDPLFPGECKGDSPHLRIVRMAHIREPRSEFVDVRSNQGIESRHIDMIGYHHQVARPEFGVDTPSRICDDELTNSKTPEHSGRIYNLGGRISFVQVDSPLQCSNRDAFNRSDYQTPGMAKDG